jgi:hypothetical protein
MDFPVSLHIPDFRPLDNSLKGIASSLPDSMVGSIESGVIDTEELAQVNGPSPVFEGNQAFGIKVNNVTLQSTPTDNRNQIFQDKDGVVALVDDIQGLRPTVILPEGLVSVDWSVADNFMCILSGNRQSAFYMAHSKDGMKVKLLLVNQGTNQTVGTWDASINWPAGSAPSMPSALVGASAFLLVELRNINNIIYGESLSYSVGSFS